MLMAGDSKRNCLEAVLTVLVSGWRLCRTSGGSLGGCCDSASYRGNNLEPAIIRGDTDYGCSLCCDEGCVTG